MIIKSDLPLDQLAMAIADIGQEEGVAVLLADVDILAGLVEGHFCYQSLKQKVVDSS
jgi:hypothetical protein